MYQAFTRVEPARGWEPAGPETGGIQEVVLLAGSVRPTPFVQALRRPVLGLPLTGGDCLLDAWKQQVAGLVRHGYMSAARVRVLQEKRSAAAVPVPAGWLGADRPDDAEVRVRFEQDSSELRGTAGALRDCAAVGHDPDDYLLVVNAAQLLTEPLSDLAADLLSRNADVAVTSGLDGVPSGVMLLRARCLDAIADVGFVDMKEQALPLIARRYDVAVLQRRRSPGMPVRTLADYVDALRTYRAATASVAKRDDPFAEDWFSLFSVVEPGAVVKDGAELLDAVVLDGGRVESGAVLVRSVVCAGGLVRAGEVVVNGVVTPGGKGGR